MLKIISANVNGIRSAYKKGFYEYIAASGALEAKRREMDAVGIITLACCTAVGGGMIRDVLIGAIPVAALVDHRHRCHRRYRRG